MGTRVASELLLELARTAHVVGGQPALEGPFHHPPMHEVVGRILPSGQPACTAPVVDGLVIVGKKPSRNRPPFRAEDLHCQQHIFGIQVLKQQARTIAAVRREQAFARHHFHELVVVFIGHAGIAGFHHRQPRRRAFLTVERSFLSMRSHTSSSSSGVSSTM